MWIVNRFRRKVNTYSTATAAASIVTLVCVRRGFGIWNMRVRWLNDRPLAVGTSTAVTGTIVIRQRLTWCWTFYQSFTIRITVVKATNWDNNKQNTSNKHLRKAKLSFKRNANIMKRNIKKENSVASATIWTDTSKTRLMSVVFNLRKLPCQIKTLTYFNGCWLLSNTKYFGQNGVGFWLKVRLHNFLSRTVSLEQARVVSGGICKLDEKSLWSTVSMRLKLPRAE
jgi:hypothetical protein